MASSSSFSEFAFVLPSGPASSAPFPSVRGSSGPFPSADTSSSGLLVVVVDVVADVVVFLRFSSCSDLPELYTLVPARLRGCLVAV